MKYKVGDKVRVRNDLVTHHLYGMYHFAPSMEINLGRHLVIVGKAEDGYIIDGTNDIYTEEMLEPFMMAIDYSGSSVHEAATDTKEDLINKPKHYTTGGIETIDFIEAKNLNFRLANAVKYLTRAEHKGSKLSDLKKAIWYIQREIDKSETK